MIRITHYKFGFDGSISINLKLMEPNGNTYDQKGLVGVGHQSIHQSIGTVKDNAKVVRIISYYIDIVTTAKRHWTLKHIQNLRHRTYLIITNGSTIC